MENSANLSLAITCMGYGYQLKATLNGQDLGMKGGQSEGQMFMGADSPMCKEAAPEIAAKHCILKSGENVFHLEFTKVGGPTDKLTLEMSKGEETEPFVKFESVNETSGSFDKTFNL